MNLALQAATQDALAKCEEELDSALEDLPVNQHTVLYQQITYQDQMNQVLQKC